MINSLWNILLTQIEVKTPPTIHINNFVIAFQVVSFICINKIKGQPLMHTQLIDSNKNKLFVESNQYFRLNYITVFYDVWYLFIMVQRQRNNLLEILLKVFLILYLWYLYSAYGSTAPWPFTLFSDRGQFQLSTVDLQTPDRDISWQEGLFKMLFSSSCDCLTESLQWMTFIQGTGE